MPPDPPARQTVTLGYTCAVTVLEPGTTFAGKYLIDGVLGKGGMGAVYSATNQAIGRRVAIKVLVADLADREDIKKRFALEARAAAVINHPGIVDVLDMGETGDGEPFIVMEHLEGATLKAVFKKHGIFSPAEAVGVIAPLLDALAAAHQAAVIHRDIKPANIFLCTRPQRAVKLLDFGISRFGHSTGLTSAGSAVGTPKYMSPEQVLGEALGPGADLYSVGAVLYELLGGRAPYDADSDIATLAKMLKETHEPLKNVRPELPAKLCAFVDSLLLKEPERRPKDARKAKDAMLAAQAAGGLDTLYEIASESARTSTNGTPRPISGPARLPVTSPGRKQSVTRMGALDAEVPAPRPSGGQRRTAKTPKPPPPRAVAESVTSLEPASAPTKSGNGLLIGGVLAVVGLGAGAALFFALRDESPAEAPVVAVAAPKVVVEKPARPVDPPANVVVTLKAEPAATRFEIDGQVQDGNPLTLTRPKDTGLSIVATAQGYEPRTLRITFSESREEAVTLTRLVAAASPPASDPKPPKGTKHATPGTGKKGNKLTVDEVNPYE